MTELVARIGPRDRIRAFGKPFAGLRISDPQRLSQPIRIEAEVDDEWPVQLDQPRGSHGPSVDAGEKVRGRAERGFKGE